MSRFGENGSHPAAVDTAEGRAGHVDDPGSSGNTGIGSYLAGADAAEGHAWQVASSGMSGNAGIGSHLAETDAAEGLAGGVPPGVNENGQVGCWDVGEGKARAAFPVRLGREWSSLTAFQLRLA